MDDNLTADQLELVDEDVVTSQIATQSNQDREGVAEAPITDSQEIDVQEVAEAIVPDQGHESAQLEEIGMEPALAEELFLDAADSSLVGEEHADEEFPVPEAGTQRVEPVGEEWEKEVSPILGLPLDRSKPMGPDQPLPDGRFADRELSWLAFNERVLEQSEDPNLPLLERLWFSAIFSSNLDEFFMVRVAGLKRRIHAGIARPTASGLAPREILDLILRRTRELTSRQAEDFLEDFLPALDEAGLHLRSWGDLNDRQKEQLSTYFRRRVFPVLTPLAVDPSHPFPYISGLSLNLAVVVRNPISGKRHFARIKVPETLPRLVNVESVGSDGAPEDFIRHRSGLTFVALEDLIVAHLDHLFPGMEIVDAHTFRVTRNEDLEVEEDDAENLLTAMEEELSRRRFGQVVRLEVTETISPFVLNFLMERLEVGHADVFKLPPPLDFTAFNELHALDIPALKYPPYVPVTAAGLSEVESSTPGDIFATLRNREVLLHHPYDSFATSVQQFITHAARDPQVLAIKQTLYRTSEGSPIVSALIEAASQGKQVVAIVEIKARFDEDANISWARQLERAGVHVVYGVLGLKTHCKLSLVIRQEGESLRRYCHVGTGNYHPGTARGYEDLGLLTADPDVTQDLTRLFNQLSGYAPKSTFRRLLVAPVSIRTGLIERIEEQVARKQRGEDAWIGIKVNSIVDEAIIDSLYRASQAGVKIDIVVRGICSLHAGVKGLSENIKVRSILGRYLEHSRIYAFGTGEDREAWIGSADLMHRNLDRRVEALVKLEDPEHVDHVIGLIKTGVSPRITSWQLRKSGAWKRRTHDKEGAPLQDIQNLLMDEASARVVGR